MLSNNSAQIFKLNLGAKLKFSNLLLLLSITICNFFRFGGKSTPSKSELRLVAN